MHYAPDFVIPCGLGTLYKCSLATVAQDKPYHEKPTGTAATTRGAVPCLFRPYLTTATGISSSSFVQVSTRQLAVSFLSKGISSTLNFHESIIGTDGTQTRNFSHPKQTLYRLSQLDCLQQNRRVQVLFCPILSVTDEVTKRTECWTPTVINNIFNIGQMDT